MGETLQCKLRIRDIVAGGIGCFLFGIIARHTGNMVLSTLASVIFGYVVALASMHLWMPWMGRTAAGDSIPNNNE
ncbi:MAG: hypothetical protein QNI91_15285 [Arenicellales bacterium]|nr:hypothetical protein [Arenicellales bacterium]